VILVDTSVLIDFLSGQTTPAVRHLEHLIRSESPIYLTPIVIQEVLQGARDEAQWEALEEYLGSQSILVPRDLQRCHLEAARIFFDCRRRGLTVRSGTDCVIAQIALEHECALLHDDRDFRIIGKVRPLVMLP
jgi:predicted nucleic acid-binding protein